MIYVKPEPRNFSDGKHRIEYTDKFKYLGCILTPDLLDDKEILKKIRQAKVQIVLLESKASTWVKKLVFQSILVNTLLFGCKKLTLNESNNKKISCLAYHDGLRKVLRLQMNTVEKYRIRNKHVCNIVLGMPPHILNIVKKRQHRNMHRENLQRQFL
jgi:hypothetical protein